MILPGFSHKRAETQRNPAADFPCNSAHCTLAGLGEIFSIVSMTTVIIPAINNEQTITEVIKFCVRQPMVSEVIVADGGSSDHTAHCAELAGAKVIQVEMPGKGIAIRKALSQSVNETIVFLNAAFDPYPSNAIRNLVHPVVKKECDFALAAIDDYTDEHVELLARPLLKLFFPNLAVYRHVCSGVFAIRRSILEKIDLFPDYGVDIALLIDLHQQNLRIREVNIGPVDTGKKSWQLLSEMSADIARAIIRKAGKHLQGKINIEELGNLYAMYSGIRHEIREEITTLRKLVVFDMDNTLLLGRFIDRCAEKFGFEKELSALRKHEKEAAVLTKRIARMLKGISSADLLKVAASIPLIEDAARVVAHLRNQGYITGIISDSYQFIVEFVRDKIGADFALGNQLEFYDGKATGEVTIPSLFYYHLNSQCGHALCKTNALIHIGDKFGVSLNNCIAVGDSENDLCMIERSGMGIAFCTNDPRLKVKADRVIENPSFKELMDLQN